MQKQSFFQTRSDASQARRFSKGALCLLLFFGLSGFLRADILQGVGANYIAWEAETDVTIANSGSATWAVVSDGTASGGLTLMEQGASDTANAASTARWRLVFQTAGTYQLYIKYKLDPCCGANSYKFPNAFGSFGPTDGAWQVSRANENGAGPTTYTVVRERLQNQTAVFATFTVAPGDVGVPQTLMFGNREAPGLRIDRIVLSTDLTLADTGDGPFDALINSGVTFAPPQVTRADSRLNPNGLQVTFNMPMDATALNPANYTLDNGVTVSGAAYAVGQPNSNVVQLTTTALTPSTLYTLTVANAQNIQGLAMSPSPQNATFTHMAGLNQAAGLTVNIYNGANTLALAKAAVANCTVPTFSSSTINVAMEYTTSERTTIAEGNTFQQGNTENYGTFIYGVFVAPTTGNYQFALSADDQSELYLSTDSNPANKVLLTSQSAWNGYRGFISGNGNPAPPLPLPVPLVAGRSYYMEVVVQEGGGGDHVSVAVRKPGDPAIADNMAPISRDLFSTNYSIGCPPTAFFQTLGPIAQTVAPLSQTVQEGANASLFVGLDGIPPYNVQWYSNGVPIPGANKQIYTFPTIRFGNGAQYHAVAANDFSSVTSSVATVTVVFDATAPTLISAVGGANRLNASVIFSEAMTASSATNIANYQITNAAGASLAITAAIISPDASPTAPHGKVVTLTTAAQNPNERYWVVVNNVTDRAGVPNTITPNPSVASFVATDLDLLSGQILFRAYPATGGNAVNTLTSHPSFPNSPDFSQLIPGMNTRLASDPANPGRYSGDTREDYGGSLVGHFIPPVSGVWILYTSADDGSRLLMNTNGPNASGKAQLLDIIPCCAPFASNPTIPLDLVAGQAYYIEALYKEGGGGDFMQVAARLAGATTALLPIPASQLGFVSKLTITQNPTNVTVAQNHDATFTVVATVAGAGSAQYQWQRSTDSTGTTFTNIPGATSSSYTLFAGLADDLFQFRAEVTLINTTNVSSAAILHVVNDNVPPVLVSARADGTFRTIHLNWSEVMLEGAATELGSYKIFDPSSNEVIVTSIIYAGSNVTLNLGSRLLPDSLYFVEADFQSDLVANPPVPVGNPVGDASGVATNMRTFVISRGFSLFSAYYNLPAGQSIDAFVAMPIYPNSPTFSFYTNLVNWPQTANPNVEQYAMRFAGLFLATETGTYRFNPSHDDDFRLQISSDEDPANQTANSLAGGCCSDLFGGATLDVAMTAGNRYYYELIVREFGGGDYAGIAVTTPSGLVSAPMNASYLAVAVDPLIGDTNNVGIAQQPQDQTIEENHSATFSVVVTNPGPFGAAYQWQLSTGGAFTDIPGAAFASYTTPLRTLANEGNQYRVRVFVLGKTITSAPATLHVITDTARPHLTLVTGGGTTVTAYFDEAMNAGAVADTGNYELRDSGNNVLALTAPVVAADNRSVSFTTPAQTMGALYTLHAQDIPDVAGNALLGTNMTFRSGRGYALFQAYNTGGGNSVSALTSHPDYPNNPDLTALIPTFDSRNVYPTDAREGYGARISGWFIPPTTGNYIFYNRSDDASDLSLSTDNNPANKILIQQELGCCNGFAAHPSAPQSLVAGRAYYLELLYKEGTGGDFGQVAVKNATDPTPPDSLTPISGVFLSAVDPGPGTPSLRFNLSGPDLVLTWDAGARLQWTGDLTPPVQWKDIDTGGATTYTVVRANEFTLNLDTAQEPPPRGTGSGRGTVSLSNNVLVVDVSYSGMSGTRNNSHFHAPAPRGVNTGVAYNLAALDSATGNNTNGGTIRGTVTLTDGAYGGKNIAAQLQDLRGGLWYLNVHSTAFPGGEIRGQVDPPVRFYRLVSP